MFVILNVLGVFKSPETVLLWDGFFYGEKNMKKIIAIALVLLVFVGCKGEEMSKTYEQITQEEAKRIMDTQTDYVLLDTRTDEEFAEGHIEGAIMIPEYEITEKAESVIPDKDTLILVYCRSGRRSKIASMLLVELGYTNVKEFGGIIDWPYEIVK